MVDIDRKAPPPLVLVVDDDADVSFALERSLKRLGFDVLIAADGDEGLQQALHARPAVILADIHMPGMDGHALLRSLMRSDLHSSVVLMSAQGEIDDAISAMREGAVDYLKKPWTADELAAVLDRAMGLFNAIRELSLAPAQARSLPRVAGAGAASPIDAAALIEALAVRATAEGLGLPATSPIAHLGGDDVAEALALRDAFPIAVAPLRTLNDRIWRFSLSRALAMRGIAEMAQVETSPDPQTYYVAGLLLDVGASFLLSVVAEAMERLRGGIADSGGMSAAIAAHHGHVGSLIVQRWGFPPELVDLARGHHTEPSSSPTALWCAALLGGALAVRVASFGDPTGGQQSRPELLARSAYTLGVGDTVLRRLTKTLTDRTKELWAAFD
ncbi:MAG TPA: response regulator [Polyangia bacterium]|jgi:CheY-like chemotaxis protein|nr:response regulator [Polyangia bacterium]